MSSECQETLRSVAVIGAAGKVGGFFTETLSKLTGVKVEPVLRGGIGSALEREPEVVILATPNPTKEVLKEIADSVKNLKRPFTLVLPQNGVDVVSTAERVLEVSRSQITIVRASFFTTVGRDEDGKIVFNKDKKRIALAAVDQDEDALQKTANMFAQADFDIRVVDDYRSMEWTKLLANLFGSTSVVTGLSPEKALSDPDIFALEHRALRDRLTILKANKIEVADLWGVGKLRWLARIPMWLVQNQGPLGRKFREYVAGKFATERNNQLPAAAIQINEGVRNVEPTNYYHLALTYSGKENGLESPVDRAIQSILRRHGRDNDFSLNSLQPDERRNLLLEMYGLETEDVFIKRFSFLGLELVRIALERIYEHYTDKFEVLGKENLKAVAEILKSGKSVLVAPNHRSHGDHTTIVKALRENLPSDTRKYPVYIVAGMKFDKEEISGRFSHAYSHLVVWTLTEGDNEEVRWKAQIINGRATKVIEKLLNKPCIVIVYLEGGRNKSENLELQPPALDSSWWVLNPNFGLIVPTVITGTEVMLPPGDQKPHHANITIEFCEGINAAELRNEKRKEPSEEWDKYFSGKVLSVIAAKLSEKQKVA